METEKKRFCSYLWGKNKAMNQVVQPDERLILSKLDVNQEDRILEPACGSGRILKELVKVSGHVTGTDVEQEILDYARCDAELSNVELVLDDVRDTALQPATYDYVMAFENVLGNFFRAEDRYTALENMLALTKRGGLLVLAYRTMNGGSMDQLDIVPDDPRLFAIWHAFSHEEIMDLVQRASEAISADVEDLIHTEYTRPIGGQESYILLRRK